MAEQILADNAADMIAMTRAHIADPFIVTKAREGREDDTIRCGGASVCISRLIDNREVVCVMNPATGRERQWGEGTLKKVSRDAVKNIAVVEGGPAGMKVAALAAKRGHHVVLYEQEQKLGGHLNVVKHLPTRQGWQVAIDNLSHPLSKAGVEVRLGATVTKELLA